MKPKFCRISNLRPSSSFAFAATICLSLSQVSHAASIYWDGASASASWATAANWSTAASAATPNPTAEPAANDDVIFNITSASAIAQIITLNGAKSALSLSFNNTLATTLRSENSTTRSITLGTGGITVNSGAGTVTIGASANGNQVVVGASQNWINNSSNNANIYNTIGRSNGGVLNLSSGTSNFIATMHALSNGLIGPWAVTGSETSLRYVTKTSNVMGAYSGGTAAADASLLTDTAGTVNYDLADANGTTPAIVAANTIRFTGASGTLASGETSFSVKGLMNAGSGKWTISTNPISIGSTNELVIIGNSQETEISSTIQNNGITASAVTYYGGGTLTLSGDNTFNNGLNIGAGKVLVNHTGALNSSALNLINFNGKSGTLALNGNNDLFVAGINSLGTGTLAQPNQIVENANASNVNLNIGGTSSNSSFYGVIQDGTGGGSLGITKTGSGTLTLGGTNTYTGTTLINTGSLSIISTAALPGWDTDGRYSVASDATLVAPNSISDADIATLLGTTNFTAGALLGFDTTSASRTYAATIADTTQGMLGITKLGVNTLTLSSANTYSGITTVASGELIIQNANSLGSTSAGSTVLGGTRIVLDGGITVTGEPATLSGGSPNFFGALQSKSGINKWTGNITIAATDTRIGAQAGSSMEVSGVIDSGISNHLIIFRPENSTATVVVSGANTYVGPTTIIGGLVNASSLNSVVGGTASSNFGAPTTAANGTITFGGVSGSGLRYTGTGETTDRVINLGGTTHGGVIDQSGTGALKFTSGVTATGNGIKSLTLQGSTAGTGEIAGPIANSTSATSIIKTGTGNWTLSGNNSYTGGTSVNAGTLKLNYDTESSGTDTSKLSDTAALTLGSSTLELVGGSHSEIVASTTLTAGTASKITRNGGSAVLQMNAITRNTGASIDFSAAGIATTDNTNTNGILGTWATINGTDWAANSTNGNDGLITAANYTDVDAQPGGSGSTVISNGSTTNVRISGNGTSPGNITLGNAPVIINTLLQSNTTQSAVIDPDSSTSDTLQVGSIMLALNAKGLSIGASPDDGFLTAASAGGELLLRNNSLTESLTIHSTIANNTSASSITKDGLGTVILTGTNTYTGATNLTQGTLKPGSSVGFNNTSALVMTENSTLDLNGYNGAFTNLTATAANTITTTGAGSGVDTLTISALSATSSALFTDNGTRQLAVSVAGTSGNPLSNLANTFSGGLTIDSTVRLSVIDGTVGTPGAITNGPFGRGPITINGGNTFNAGAQIWFGASNRNLVNDVIVNGYGGNGNRGGSFRIGTNSTALSNLVISGNINANLADAHFGSDSTADGTALLLSGKLTGNSGFRFFLSSNNSKWTTTLNNATSSPNDYAGNTSLAGAQTTLALGAAQQIPNGTGKGNVAITNGTLDLAGFDETINGLTGAGIVDNVANGTSNTLTLGDGDATGTSFTGVIKNTTGTLSLTKIGTGTQTLTGLNSYSGPTTVSDGTLLINGDQSEASGTVQVNSGTLGGIGKIGGAVNIASDGTLAPGTVGGIGSLTINSNINIAGTLACDVDNTSTDALEVLGDLVLTNGTLEINEITPATPGTYIIATYTGSRTGTLGGNLPSGYSVTYDDANQEVELVVAAASGYTTWATTNTVTEGENGDDDKDGITNLVEYALGLNPKLANPSPGTLTGNLLSFTKGAEAAAAADVTYAIETSATLAPESWVTVTPDTNDSSIISYTLPTGVGGKNFARLKISKP